MANGLQPLETQLGWEDLVLDEAARREVEDIAAWIRHRDRLLEDWRLNRFLRRSYWALFDGAPGTGKRLTAALLGKTCGLPVYRVVDPEAELPANAILVLDRAANQQTEYLLQRLEDFPGVVIVVTNLRDHLDEAFARRFQSVIHFHMPAAEQRLEIWQLHFAHQQGRLADDVDLHALAQAHELTGGDIAEVLRFACIRAAGRAPAEITRQDLLDGIRRRTER